MILIALALGALIMLIGVLVGVAVGTLAKTTITAKKEAPK